MLISEFGSVGWEFCSLVFVSTLSFQRMCSLSIACFTSLLSNVSMGDACCYWRLWEREARRRWCRDPPEAWMGGGKLPQVFCCSTIDDPENWAWGYRKSGVYLWTAYLVFWKGKPVFPTFIVSEFFTFCLSLTL